MSVLDINIGGIIDSAASLVNTVGNQIRGKVPVDSVELAKLEIEIGKLTNAKVDILAKIDEAQNLINLENAKSTSFWQSGWRPTVAWLCVAALFWAFIVSPVIMIFYPTLPKLDMGELITMLFGLLGLGTLRTVEKLRK